MRVYTLLAAGNTVLQIGQPKEKLVKAGYYELASNYELKQI